MNDRSAVDRPSILILGAGAIGGYFGGRLVEAGADVTFLVRPARQATLLRDGLRVVSPSGDINLPVQTTTAVTPAARHDLVLLTCKAYDLPSAIDAIAPAMSGSCAVIPLLNGLSHLERLDARFGASQVMGGTCMIDGRMHPDGTIEHRGTLQRLVFGERDGVRSARAERFAALLEKTPIVGELADNIMQRLWDKLVFLSALAATTSLFRGNVREIMAAPGGRAAMERTLDANAAIAAAEGFPQAEASLAFARERLTDPAGDWSASLARDEEGGGQIESDHIVGWMLDRARRHGVDDTMLALAYTGLKTYEARRDSGRLPGTLR